MKYIRSAQWWKIPYPKRTNIMCRLNPDMTEEDLEYKEICEGYPDVRVKCPRCGLHFWVKALVPYKDWRRASGASVRCSQCVKALKIGRPSKLLLAAREQVRQWLNAGHSLPEGVGHLAVVVEEIDQIVPNFEGLPVSYRRFSFSTEEIERIKKGSR